MTTLYLGHPKNYDPEAVANLLQTKQIRSIANLEKAIFSLEYIAQLKKTGLDFIFKGGSAVQILLGDKWNRLSVDADICTTTPEKELDLILKNINRRFGDTNFQHDKRESELQGPFVSYRIRTPPLTDIQRTILLDAQLVKPEYTIQNTKLESFFYKSEIKVQTPTSNSILGDKMSVIGSHTIGRKLKTSQNGVEYAKHFYDINSLAENLTNFNETKQTYSSTIKIQEKIRGQKYQREECIEDAAFTCHVASLPQDRGEALIQTSPTDKQRALLEFTKLKSGLSQFRPFTVDETIYTWDELRKYSTTTSVLLELVRKNATAEKAKAILHSNPIDALGLSTLIRRIRDVEKEKRWFIDLEEITAFHEILANLYKYFYIDELLET